METSVINKKPASIQEAHVKSCPECVNEITHVEQLNEDDSVFTWYECIKDGCAGQWLQKFSQHA